MTGPCVGAVAEPFTNYTLPYLVTFVGLKLSEPASVLGFVFFMLLFGALTIKTQALWINPLLALRGFRLYEASVQKDGGDLQTILVLSENPLRVGERCRADYLTEHQLYVTALIHLQPKKGPALMAFRRVQASWKAKRVFGLINTLLKGKVLVTAEEERIFRFEQKIDFFAVDGLIFVLDKSGFESALNFRAGMEKKRDSLVQTLIATNLYLNLELVSKLSSTHVRWLKKLAGAHRLGKCTEADWVTRLIACCKEKGWPVVLVNGQVEITDANCELIVRLMNYDLLESPVDHAMFKIDGAKEAF